MPHPCLPHSLSCVHARLRVHSCAPLLSVPLAYPPAELNFQPTANMMVHMHAPVHLQGPLFLSDHPSPDDSYSTIICTARNCA